MNMHNPPHPGTFIKETYLAPFEISVRAFAQYLKVSPSTINRIINNESSITPEMACRLSATIGRSPESWLIMQANYDLWKTKKPKLRKINFDDFKDAA